MGHSIAREPGGLIGMAASDNHLSAGSFPSAGGDWLLPSALGERLDEEIRRAERQGTDLSCLLVVIDNLEEMAREHGLELREETLGYIAAALRRELRRFDRIGRPSDSELLIVLPGADGPRGEMVARRVIDRLRTIKVEARGSRRPLQVSIGLAAWRDETNGEDLLMRTRFASHRETDDPPVAFAGEDPGGPGELSAAGAGEG
jgi:diguanylate cyclase (GGDEF)-like protein